MSTPDAVPGRRYAYAWEFVVAPGCRQAFLAAYGRDGTWVSLFRKSPGYLGTWLLEDRADPDRFLTIDRWATAGAHAAFVEAHGAEYRAIDAACADLTVRETSLGEYWEADDGGSPTNPEPGANAFG